MAPWAVALPCRPPLFNVTMLPRGLSSLTSPAKFHPLASRVPAHTDPPFFTASPSPFPRTLAPTDLLATPSSTSLPPPRPSAPSLSLAARRSWSARSPFSLPASLSLLERRPRVPTERALVRVTAADHLAVAVDVAVAAVVVAPVVAA